MPDPSTEAGSAERPLSAPDRLAALFETLGLDRTAALVSPDSTLRPGELAERLGDPGATVRGGGRRGPDAGQTEPFLPTITLGERASADAPDAPSSDLVLTEVLGEGGMGVVHGAAQRSLGRTVAVKRPRGEAGGGDASALVAEARTMALVEHPNVVPVYALGRDASERPVLVMKRIAGASLKELLRDRAHAEWPRLEARWGDQERACLGILGEVCDALTLAHAHGIVHRDVKPENVMVGEFGEVYLLDWGIACRTSSDVARGSIVGTPGFMAPEMVLDPDHVDARTDVYLLGATLHNVLTGKLRHSGASFFETLSAALASEPVAYDAGVPDDLASLANAATALDPAERPASAAEFRRALAEHERHREAGALVQAARAAHAKLGEMDLAGADAAALLSEASAALAAARAAYPAGASVRAAAHEHVRLALTRELKLESPRAARALLERLEPPDASLEAEVVALERRLAAAKASAAELRTAREQADVRGSLGLRVAVAVAIVAVLAYTLTQDTASDAIDLSMVTLNDAAMASIVLIGAIAGRRTLFANAGNRRLTFVSMGVFAATGLTNAIGLATGIGGAATFAFTFLVAAAYLLLAALLAYPRLAPAPPVGFAWAAAFVGLPEHAATLLPLATVTFFGVTVACFVRVVRERPVDGTEAEP